MELHPFSHAFRITLDVDCRGQLCVRISASVLGEQLPGKRDGLLVGGTALK